MRLFTTYGVWIAGRVDPRCTCVNHGEVAEVARGARRAKYGWRLLPDLVWDAMACTLSIRLVAEAGAGSGASGHEIRCSMAIYDVAAVMFGG